MEHVYILFEMVRAPAIFVVHDGGLRGMISRCRPTTPITFPLSISHLLAQIVIIYSTLMITMFLCFDLHFYDGTCTYGVFDNHQGAIAGQLARSRWHDRLGLSVNGYCYVVVFALMGCLTIIRERLLDSLREADGTTD